MKRILIVDDDADILEGIAMALEESYEVATVTSGLDALARIRGGEHFDAAVIDLMMPQMDGCTLARELHAIEAELPVVLMSAAPMVAQEASSAGARGFLVKPFSLTALERMLAGL